MPWLVQDNSDDVRAVAAEALLPLAHSLAADPPQPLQNILWDILLQVEELSPSTGQLLFVFAVVYLYICLSFFSFILMKPWHQCFVMTLYLMLCFNCFAILRHACHVCTSF